MKDTGESVPWLAPRRNQRPPTTSYGSTYRSAGRDVRKEVAVFFYLSIIVVLGVLALLRERRLARAGDAAAGEDLEDTFED